MGGQFLEEEKDSGHKNSAIMTHDKSHFSRLMLTLIFGIWASEPPSPGPGERLKRPGLIGLKSIYLAFNVQKMVRFSNETSLFYLRSQITDALDKCRFLRPIHEAFGLQNTDLDLSDDEMSIMPKSPQNTSIHVQYCRFSRFHII